MCDGHGQPLEWTVPVITKPDRQRRALRVTVVDGEVLMDPPRTALAVPSESVDQLCEALKAALEVAQQMGRGLR